MALELHMVSCCFLSFRVKAAARKTCLALGSFLPDPHGWHSCLFARPDKKAGIFSVNRTFLFFFPIENR